MDALEIQTVQTIPTMNDEENEESVRVMDLKVNLSKQYKPNTDARNYPSKTWKLEA